MSKFDLRGSFACFKKWEAGFLHVSAAFLKLSSLCVGLTLDLLGEGSGITVRKDNWQEDHK